MFIHRSHWHRPWQYAGGICEYKNEANSVFVGFPFAVRWRAPFLVLLLTTLLPMVAHGAAKTQKIRGSAPAGVASGARVTVSTTDPDRGICNRTAQVRDKIVEQLKGSSLNRLSSDENCSDVSSSDLEQITRLRLFSDDKDNSLQEGDFNGLSSLTELRLYNNQLTTLPANAFNGLSSLTSLDLRAQRLVTISTGTFNGLSSLTHLYLHNNQLTTLPANAFNGLSSLTRLDLGSHQLTTLPAGVFNGLSSLTRLDLRAQRLVTISTGTFNGLSSLTHLYLHNNQLTTLPANAFNGLSSLTSLSLDNNQLSILPAGVFSGLSSFVSISSNQDDGYDVRIAPLSLTLSSSSILENGGTSLVMATLNVPSNTVITLQVLATAVSPAVATDFIQSGMTLTIVAGQTTSTGVVTLTGVDNSVDATDKTLMVSATVSSGNGVSAPSTLILTLIDDDVSPTKPTITAPTAAVVNTASIDITGTGEADATVTLSRTTTALSGAPTATVDGSGGTWSINVTLVEGTNEFTATATDAAGNISEASDAVTITLDTTLPTKPLITQPTTPTNDASIDISGTGEAGSTIQLLRADPAFTSVAIAVDGSGGTWTINVTLVEGANEFTATATDVAGNISEPSNAVTITYIAPAAPPATPVAGNDLYVSSVILGVKSDGSIGWSADSNEYLNAQMSTTVISLAGTDYKVSEIAYKPGSRQFKFVFEAGVPDDIANMVVSFNPDLNFKDATRTGNTFTWTNVDAAVTHGQHLTLKLSRISSAIGQFNLDVDGIRGTTVADGIMIVRYLSSLSGPLLTAGQSTISPAIVQRNIVDLIPTP